jgi:branched-chain amino acid transport system ATP-binding protein
MLGQIDSIRMASKGPASAQPAMSTEPILRIDDLHTGYGPVEVIKGISLTVGCGEIVALLGANGAGKSTTLMTISGINKARSGEIVFQNKTITNKPAHEIVRLGICQAPEGRRIFPRLTVRENLEMGAFVRAEQQAIAEDLALVLELFPILKQRQEQLGGTLSGGEQQMLAIARALMSRPKLLLLDEPSLGLAPMVMQKIFGIIRDVNRKGVTVFLVEQNAHMALTIAHRGYVLQTGRIVFADSGANLLKSPEVRKAYLGE